MAASLPGAIWCWQIRDSLHPVCSSQCHFIGHMMPRGRDESLFGSLTFQEGNPFLLWLVLSSLDLVHCLCQRLVRNYNSLLVVYWEIRSESSPSQSGVEAHFDGSYPEKQFRLRANRVSEASKSEWLWVNSLESIRQVVAKLFFPVAREDTPCKKTWN